MPAKHLKRLDGEKSYSHVYNKGVEKRNIFNDQEDYGVFLGYLKDYLTPPRDPESVKKSFTVKGHVFRGTPHQPKNYFNKVELIAYNLKPNRFHLLLRQITSGSLEGLIRSLFTRYSMYFNKKYNHTGALFEGPYKSVQIKDNPRLLLLTHYLHHSEGYSSYEEYLGTRETSWIKPKLILSFFDKIKADSFKGTNAYKDFVEKYELDQKGNELLEGVILEKEKEDTEGRDSANDVGSYLPGLDQNLEPKPRTVEFLVTSALAFILLVSISIRNITASTTKSPNPPATLGASVSSTPSPTPTPQLKTKPVAMLTIKVSDIVKSVNIRQKPTTASEKIGEAKNGDTFEFVSVDSGWYEVKLPSGSTGFISAKYVLVKGANSQ